VKTQLTAGGTVGVDKGYIRDLGPAPPSLKDEAERIGMEEGDEGYESGEEVREDLDAAKLWLEQVRIDLVRLDTMSWEFLRSDMIEAVFKKLDPKKTLYLGPSDLRSFAEMTGFVGDDRDWAREYRTLAREFGFLPNSGVNMTVFKQVVNADEGPTFCTIEELAAVYQNLYDKIASAVPADPLRRRIRGMKFKKEYLKNMHMMDHLGELERQRQDYSDMVESDQFGGSKKPAWSVNFL